MTEEYARLMNSEKTFGAKTLLQSQVFLLNAIKNIQKYDSVRNEELAAKILLRKKLAEVEDELKVLDKIMPRVREKSGEESETKKAFAKKGTNLESEIEEIRRRIERIK